MIFVAKPCEQKLINSNNINENKIMTKITGIKILLGKISNFNISYTIIPAVATSTMLNTIANIVKPNDL